MSPGASHWRPKTNEMEMSTTPCRRIGYADHWGQNFPGWRLWVFIESYLTSHSQTRACCSTGSLFVQNNAHWSGKFMSAIQSCTLCTFLTIKAIVYIFVCNCYFVPGSAVLWSMNAMSVCLPVREHIWNYMVHWLSRKKLLKLFIR